MDQVVTYVSNLIKHRMCKLTLKMQFVNCAIHQNADPTTDKIAFQYCFLNGPLPASFSLFSSFQYS